MVTAHVWTCCDCSEEKATSQTEVQGGGLPCGRVNTGGEGRRSEEREGGTAGEEVCEGVPGAVLLSRQERWLPICVVGIKITQDDGWGGKLVKEVAEL